MSKSTSLRASRTLLAPGGSVKGRVSAGSGPGRGLGRGAGPQPEPGPGRGGSVMLRQGVIEQHFLSSHCAVCDEQTLPSHPLCPRCVGNPRHVVAVLMARTARLERQHAHMVRMCLHCGGGGGGEKSGVPGGGRVAMGSSEQISRRYGQVSTGETGQDSLAAVASGLCAGAGNVVCESLDCGVYFERRKLVSELDIMSGLTQDSCDMSDW